MSTSVATKAHSHTPNPKNITGNPCHLQTADNQAPADHQSQPDRVNAPAPSLHQRALYTWLAVYTAITTVQLLLGPEIVRYPLEVRTLVLTGIVVPAVVYVLVPNMLRVHTAITRRRHSHRGGVR